MIKNNLNKRGLNKIIIYFYIFMETHRYSKTYLTSN